MTVIPFDPSRPRAARAAKQLHHAGSGAEPRHEVYAHIALLEQALVQVLRENAQNWARAEAAEARLAVVEREEMR